MKKENHQLLRYFWGSFIFLFFCSISCSTFFQAFSGPKIEKTKSFGPIEKTAQYQKNKNADKQDKSLSGQKIDILPEITVAATILNIRSGPGGTFSIIGQCKKNDKFQVMGKNSVWIKIKLENNKEGWVYGPYTEMTKKDDLS